MKNTAVLITTFMRDEALFHCVRSIRKFYPDIPIFVADCGENSLKKQKFLSRHNAQHIPVKYDAGVCAMRNEGFSRMPEKYKYIAVIEDDIIFTPQTKLENWRDILRVKRNIGIVGGQVKKIINEQELEQGYEATLERKENSVYVKRIDKPAWKKAGDVRYFLCDIVVNVFMIRRAVWEKIKWDERYKTTPEHTDFFLLVKENTNWRIAYTDSVELEHHIHRFKHKDYAPYRSRRDGYEKLADKWGVKQYWNDWNEQWGHPNPIELYSISGKKQKASLPKRKSKIAVAIKTFMREDGLFKVVESIEKNMPFSYKLYIADDGDISNEKEFFYQRLKKKGHRIIRLPFNSGLSAGRNAIIREVKEDYVLLSDDDLMLSNPDSVKAMKEVLDSRDDIGICAGVVRLENGEHFGGKGYSRGLRFEMRGGALFRHPSNGNADKVNGIRFNYADQVVNFFLAKKAVFGDVRWDSRIKVEYEHMDFFLSLKETRWKAVVCQQAKATHIRQPVNRYYERFRRAAPTKYFYQKHDIGNVINKYR